VINERQSGRIEPKRESIHTHTGKLGDKGIEVRIRKIKEEGEIHVN